MFVILLLHVQHKVVTKNVHTLIQHTSNSVSWLETLRWSCVDNSENGIISRFLLIILLGFLLHVKKGSILFIITRRFSRYQNIS